MGKYVICNICFGGMGFWGKSGKGEGGDSGGSPDSGSLANWT